MNYLDGDHFRGLVVAGAGELRAQAKAIDSINVFPVPDGDTGTNMQLTMATALDLLRKSPGSAVARAAALVAQGTLMGARGNSGVIFSQLWRGFAQGTKMMERVTPRQLAAALQLGVRVAYRAVMKPQEGTILTVAREASAAAREAAHRGADITGVMTAARDKARLTLDRTPEMLPALKEAGVVDAGGLGLVVFLEGALQYLRGDVQPILEDRPGLSSEPWPVNLPAESEQPELAEVLAYRYCAEYLVKGSADEQNLRRELAGLGDCLLVVGSSGLTKVHLHTNNPGQALEIGLKNGDLHAISISNMEDQREQRPFSGMKTVPGLVDNSQPVAAVMALRATTVIKASEPTVREPVERGIVAIAGGAGLAQIMQSLGADEIVPGGETMNPSAREIADAITRTNARQVFVLPNHKNAVMAARQAVDLAGGLAVKVVPTISAPQGIAAVLAAGNAGPGADLEQALLAAARAVITIEIARANRETVLDGRKVRRNEFLALVDGQLAATGPELGQVAQSAIGQVMEHGHELVTIYYGQDLTATETASLAAPIRKVYPALEVEIYAGGQPVYLLIISVE